MTRASAVLDTSGSTRIATSRSPGTCVPSRASPGWAALVWGYALAWFLVTDRVKLLAYRLLARSPAPPAAADTPPLGKPALAA